MTPTRPLTLHLTDDDTQTLIAMGLDAHCRAEVIAESIVLAAIRQYAASHAPLDPRPSFPQRGALARRLHPLTIEREAATFADTSNVRLMVSGSRKR